MFITSTHDAPGTNRLEITGEGGKIVIEKGKLVFTENEEMEPAFSEHNTVFMGKPKTKKYKYRGIGHYLAVTKYPPQHVGIIKNYTDYLLKKTDKFTAPGEQGIVGLTFSNAIHLASWTHKEVQIPFDEDLYISELENARKPKKKTVKIIKYTKKGVIMSDISNVAQATEQSFISRTSGLKSKDYIGYAMGDTACCLVFGLVTSFLQKFYTDIFSLSPLFIMLMFIGARVWDAINDPVMGRLCDTIKLSNGEDIVRGSYGQRVR